ncbi:hypothetical protein TSMEX_003786, partial [Taenia solium]
VKTGSEYQCTACYKEHNHFKRMHWHLLRHGNCKFYFCVHCLEGFSMLKFAFDHLDVVSFLTEQERLTERDVINRLRLRLLRAAPDPKGYRLTAAEKKDSASSSTSS